MCYDRKRTTDPRRIETERQRKKRKRETDRKIEKEEEWRRGGESGGRDATLWKNITCWTAKERERRVGMMEREREAPREKVGENERTVS